MPPRGSEDTSRASGAGFHLAVGTTGTAVGATDFTGTNGAAGFTTGGAFWGMHERTRSLRLPPGRLYASAHTAGQPNRRAVTAPLETCQPYALRAAAAHTNAPASRCVQRPLTLRLTKDHIRGKAAHVDHRRKSGRPRVIPLPAKAAKIARKSVPFKHQASNVTRRWNAAKEAAGMLELRLHDLRRAFA